MKQSDKDILQCQCWKSMALLYINDQSEKEIGKGKKQRKKTKGKKQKSFVYNCFRKNKLLSD